MKRIPMRSKDLNVHSKVYALEITKKDLIEQLDDKIIMINKVPSFFWYEKRLVPTIKMLLEHSLLKQITVDMGAIKFIVGGADVMRPGVLQIDGEIKKGDFVEVRDVNNKRPLAVCIALFDAEEMQNLKSGKVLKNIHHVGDDVWNAT